MRLQFLHQYGPLVGKILGSFFGWAVLWPLSQLMPRDRNRFAVIGRDQGKFLDNSKYCFISLHRLAGKQRRIVFLSDHPEVRASLRAHGCPASRLSGPLGWWQLLRCGTVIVDNIDWGSSGRFTAACGARIVQLWHGVPLKRIELLVERQLAATLPNLVAAFFHAYRCFIGRHRRADYLVATSTAVAEKAMQICFKAHHWPVVGYPRNDVLLDKNLRRHPLVALGVDEQALTMARTAKAAGHRIVLYAPTFRKHMQNPFSEESIDLKGLSTFAECHHFLFLIKLHPLLCASPFLDNPLHHISVLRPDSDIYPLIPETDILITDYSSIFFDYLLLDKPVLFYSYDLETYLREDRGFLFDYEEMTPGPKVKTLGELEKKLLEITQGVDQWSDQRKRVREIVFDHSDGSAVKRLLAVLDGG